MNREILLRYFLALEHRRFPLVVGILILWALFVFPAVGLRNFRLEEGHFVALARGALEDGHWLTPHFYGMRFVERPNLLAWLLAILGAVRGEIDQLTARLPSILGLLAAAVLVFAFVRRRASELAALFAAICLLASPMVLQKVIIAEPDVLLSVTLFFAFVVWWDGQEAGCVIPLRWGVVGLILAVAALWKGPQPLAYFGFGVGAFLLLRRQWRDIAGLSFAGLVAAAVTAAWYWAVYRPGDFAKWILHSRVSADVTVGERIAHSLLFLPEVALQMVPALLLAAPLVILMLRKPGEPTRDLVLALALYAAICTVVLALWHGARVRYAMPAILPLSVLAGLGFDRFRAERPRLVDATVVVAAGLVAFQLIFSWLVMPMWPDTFQRSRTAAHVVDAALKAAPGTLQAFYTDAVDKNVLAYLAPPIRVFRDAGDVNLKPGWALVSPQQARIIEQRRPDLRIRLHAILDIRSAPYLVEILPRQAGSPDQ